MNSWSRPSAAVVAVLLSAGLVSACSPQDGIIPADDSDETAEEAVPSNEPTVENATSADDVDTSLDVALQGVDTATESEDGMAVSFDKDGGDEAGMHTGILVDETELRTVVTSQDGTSVVETIDSGEAEETVRDLAPEVEVPLLRAMAVARGDSAGMVLEAHLEDREGELIVWHVTMQGPDSENVVVIDARNGAIVPEGDNPVEEQNIGGDPDAED
ncbi:MAG: hypothetical protein Q4F53_03950 [Nesterenkonia sp.]|nr:hypothetical protein [Nesterenkonia sp.]